MGFSHGKILDSDRKICYKIDTSEDCIRSTRPDKMSGVAPDILSGFFDEKYERKGEGK